MKRIHALLVPALTLALAGCAGLVASYDVTPAGLYRGDEELRRYLAEGRPERALDRVASGHRAAPTDPLLRLLYEGVTARHAGLYRESAHALDRAAALAEDRQPTSVSRTAAAVLVNDRALPYTPNPTERLLIHYYAALSHLDAGDLGAAVVEARRLGFLLQLRERERNDAERRRDAVLRYFTGTVFEAAGEANDAAVAYRYAQRLARELPPTAFDFALPGDPDVPTRDRRPGTGSPDTGSASGTVGDTAAGPPTAASEDAAGDTAPELPPAVLPAGYGELVVLLEQGFVAHRVEESLNILLLPEEARRFAEGDVGERAAAAAQVAARVLADAAFVGETDTYWSHPGRSRHIGPWHGDRSPYLLRVAWPSYRRDLRVAPPPLLQVDGGDAVPFRLAARVSEAVMADFREERTAILTRAILRAAAKFALTQEVEQRTRRAPEGTEEEDEEAQERERERWWLSTLLGAAANLGAAALEQADTRAWNLLPDQLGIARLQLPAGRHELGIRVPAGIGAAPQSLELGSVEVAAGEIRFVTARVWR